MYHDNLKLFFILTKPTTGIRRKYTMGEFFSERDINIKNKYNYFINYNLRADN